MNLALVPIQADTEAQLQAAQTINAKHAETYYQFQRVIADQRSTIRIMADRIKELEDQLQVPA